MSIDARNKVIELTQAKYGKLIRTIAFEILKDYDLVEDVQQEVLWNMISKHADKTELPPKELKNLLCTITRNKAIDFYRKRQKNETVEEAVFDLREMTMDYIDKEAFHDKYGFGDEVKKFLKLLTYVDKDIIYLYYGEGYNCREIGEILDFDEEYIKKRLYRARLKLKTIITESEGGDIND